MTRFFSPLFVILTLLTACGPENGVTGKKGSGKPATPVQPRLSTLVEPVEPVQLALGQDIPVRLEYPDSVSVDSVQIFLGGALMHTLDAATGFPEGGPVEARIPTGSEKAGKSGLRLRIYFRGGATENQSRQVTFLSSQPPVEYTYSLVREYPHDVKAYTQGLQYVDGWLYEGTGNYGTSSLRKVNLESGKVEKIRNLDPALFGEGIAVMGERIYQLTYKSQVGFIYDLSSFEEIQKVYYQNKEGWGLTHNVEELIMSDGTHVIYFLDPELFTVTRQIEVYDHKGRADSLNELEYINGKIWANRYYTDEIVIIDPETGIVEGRINLKGILKAGDRRSGTDVLNGIAWDEEDGRLFVTGKYWPKLFEITLRKLG
ncbi:MAG: glutaminyl-peptide cyclotransferase [Bacteroidetes bacterium]|nr:glutaminyl-peptide cyclotransferase [Bacteroidota bacterium]